MVASFIGIDELAGSFATEFSKINEKYYRQTFKVNTSKSSLVFNFVLGEEQTKPIHDKTYQVGNLLLKGVV
jgi:hypothetical protein